DAFNNLYGERANRGTDRTGLSVASGDVKKEIGSLYLDNTGQMPTVSFGLSVTSDVKDGQVFKHIGDGTPKYTVNPDAPGTVEQGNIDLSQRPVRRNADGSVSTVLSMSFEEDGKEILVPK